MGPVHGATEAKTVLPVDDEFDTLLHTLRAFGFAIENARTTFAQRHDLMPNDTLVLGELTMSGRALKPTDIAGRLEVSTGTLTAMLDRLERARLVRRIANPDDRRSLLVEFDPAGSHRVEQVFEALAVAVHRAVDPAERAELTATVTRLTEALTEATDAM